MRVTLAKTQPREPYACDSCVGNLPEMPREEMNATIRSMKEPIGELGVQRFNVLIPGEGTHQFVLHPACAEDLRKDLA